MSYTATLLAYGFLVFLVWAVYVVERDYRKNVYGRRRRPNESALACPDCGTEMNELSNLEGRVTDQYCPKCLVIKRHFAVGED
jgi:hypothetical protein